MKKLLFPSLLFCLCSSVSCAPTATSPTESTPVTQPVTKTKILYDGDASPAIDDLKMALEGYDAGTIQLERTDLGDRTGQEFYLVKKGAKTYIKYTVETSLENAVYTLLGKWGFHWYGPGANWFVKPKTIPSADIAGAWITPTFRNRSFFGTGGLDYPKAAPFDPQNSYKTAWYAWKRRNRFNSDFTAAGHIGMAFYQENKALCDAHPEWFNGESGKTNGRIKIEVLEAVAAFKAWVMKKAAAVKSPFVVVDVEPEDGRGGADDPLPPAGFGGIAKWNHADKWWWLANDVAKEYPENDKHIVVSMYAYGNGPFNALTPSFPLRKNAYPVIIPYAFQSAYLPAEMVKPWGEKIDGRMGLYDYWNITQWSVGMPQFYLYGMKDKLKFWHDNKVDGTYIESTEAAGPMGHAWWIAGQLQFDLNKDFNKVYQQYLNDCFGKGAQAMKKMYDRWSNNPQGAGEVSLSLADLKAAEKLVVKSSPEWKRINELKAYVHFMKLWYEHDGTQKSKDKIFEYLYSINHLFMVQTAAFMGQYYIPPFDKGNTTPAGTDKHLTPEEIDAQFQQDLKSNPKLYDVSDFKFDYTKAQFTVPMNENSWRFGRSSMAYFVPQKSETISFEAGVEGETSFSVFTDDGILLNANIGPANFDTTETIDGRTWRMKKFTLKVEAGKKYYARFRGGFNRFKMDDEIVVFNAHGNDDFDNYGYPAQYFYVPKDCDEIVFEDKLALRPDGTSATGVFYLPGETKTIGPENRGTPLGIKNLYRVKVQPEWKGKVIACRFAHTAWSLKNLPQVLAMQPFEYVE